MFQLEQFLKTRIKMTLPLYLIGFVLSSVYYSTTGEISTPENVSACVTYRDNDTLLNVQWDILTSHLSSSALYIINYFSNESDSWFENSVIQSVDFRNKTDIFIPANFTGQQIQVQVVLTFVGFVGQESASTPITVDIRPVYLDSFAINSTGNVTTLQMTFNLACNIESKATCVVDVIPLDNNNHLITTHRQIHNITNEEDLFHPQQVILTFPDIMVGLEYIVRAHLLSSEGVIIGPESLTVSSVPFGSTPEPTQATASIATATTVVPVSSPEASQPMSSNVIQPTTVETTTTISNTPTLASDSASKSSNSLSTVAVVIITNVVTMVISISLTSVVVIIIVKKCKKTEETQKPPVNQMAAINGTTTDVNTERNPAYVQMESNPACNNIMNMEIENNLADVKMQGDPAYQIFQREDSRRDEDDYYY